MTMSTFSSYVRVAMREKKAFQRLLRLPTTWQGPRQSHEEVSQVIGMSDEPPPARHQQTFPRCCGDGLQSCKWRAVIFLSA